MNVNGIGRAALSTCLVVVTLLATIGCTSKDVAPEQLEQVHLVDARADVPRLPWPRTFSESAVLLADEIIVEGPADLVEHFVLTQHPELYYETKTTEEGLRQEIRIGSPVGGLQIQGQLDAWELVALRRMVVLQRPAWVPVRVRAVGNAWWSRADGSEERRNNVLEFHGARGD